MANKSLAGFDFQETFRIFEPEIEHNDGLRDVSVAYIHKSQDALNRNLVNFKLQRLLREAYAIPYSMGPCKFL